MAKKTKKFKTEVSELLNLVINSLYSKKEVFLRELISNASDAIDRARFSALTDGSQSQEEPYQITITPDKESKTLTISDNGIGMTHKEVEENIGTVASSGTKKFLEAMKETAGAPELIGQFGVGFYAAFMVADKVDLKTRKRGETAVMWSSDGTDSYQIGEIEEDVAPGTEITIHVRDDMPEFLESWTIRETVRRYSDYIEYPIVLMPDPSAEKDEDDEDEEKTGEEPQTLNSMKAIWKRSADEVSKDDLNNFYKHIAHDSADPLATIQVSVEGATEFTALLFIPSTAPYDMFFANAKQGLHLYARNVFIGDDIKELLPRYLSFVRGVVESSDLPLNVSREMLQDDGIIRRIRKVLISRIISKIQDMMKNQPEDFVKFNRQFGRMIKEGVHSDWENFDKLKELITFPSTLSDDESKIVTLKEYVERMPSSQKEIYYISADTFSSAKNSPLLEVLEQHGYEVLFFTEPVDAFVAERLREYDGKKLQAADRGELNLDDDKKEKDEDGKPKPTEADKKFKPLTDYIAERFKEDVKTVRISSRLTDSASCLVADEYGHTAHMERVMRTFNENMPKSLRIMELNPDHPVTGKMLELANTDKESSELADYADLLFGQAQLAEGSPLENPSHFNKLVSKLMM